MSLGPGVPDMADKVCLSCRSRKDRNRVVLPVRNNHQKLVYLNRKICLYMEKLDLNRLKVIVMSEIK